MLAAEHEIFFVFSFSISEQKHIISWLFGSTVDLMLTSHNAIARHFVRRAIYSGQSPIGRNIAVIRHRNAIYVIDINVNRVHRQYPFSHPELSGTAWCILELLCISNNENDLLRFTKSDVDTMINALCTC